MYGNLLRIKAHREQNAAQALRMQQRLVEQQVLTLEQTREDAARFHTHRLAEEQRLFEEIRGQLVALRAIEDMNRHIAGLREQEALLATRILNEEKRLQELQKALDEARRRRLAAVREREKFDQFVAVQRAIEHGQQVMREEAELEEIASAAHQARQET